LLEKLSRESSYTLLVSCLLSLGGVFSDDMNFQDIGIIIAKKPLKEHSSIVLLFTKEHGLYSGVIYEASYKSRSIYQIGNLVDFYWKARLIEHIGSSKCELIKSYSNYFIGDKTKLYAFNSIINTITFAFHEREPHNNFFLPLKQYLDNLAISFNFLEYIKIELEILKHSGYELQLERCAVTNAKHDLTYVSPKSGKAVSTSSGAKYADKLLPLPKFLSSAIPVVIDEQSKRQALELTSYFFNRYFFHNAQLQSVARNMFIEHILCTKT
jgi:DNA repair protein RecO (recombination protein O)